MVLVPENTLERLQQRQQILTPPVTPTLKNLDSQMGDILESKQLGDEEKAKLIQPGVATVLDLLRSAEKPASPCDVNDV